MIGSRGRAAGWREGGRRECRGRAWVAVVVAVLLVLVALASGFAGSATAASQTANRLVVAVSGLPPSQRPAVVVRGPGMVRVLSSDRLVLARLAPGRYVISVRELRLARGWQSIKAGARVFPRVALIVVRMRQGSTTNVDAAYGTIVNPGVGKLPGGLRGVVGDPSDPAGLVYAGHTHVPAVGMIMVARPSSQLPYGLIAKIRGCQFFRVS